MLASLTKSPFLCVISPRQGDRATGQERPWKRNLDGRTFMISTDLCALFIRFLVPMEFLTANFLTWWMPLRAHWTTWSTNVCWPIGNAWRAWGVEFASVSYSRDHPLFFKCFTTYIVISGDKHWSLSLLNFVVCFLLVLEFVPQGPHLLFTMSTDETPTVEEFKETDEQKRYPGSWTPTHK